MTDSQRIDEELYSRQIYVLGVEAMQKMAKSSILISGLGGLGVEIAKNVILAGINQVDVQDTENVKMIDIGAQFYLKESDIGKNRALVSLPQLSALNRLVTVKASDQPMTTDVLSRYNTVVFTEPLQESKLLEYSKFCNEKGICFIACETSGVFGTTFNDFGKDFVAKDTRGEPETRFMIEYITNDEKGTVTCADRAFHNLTDGEEVMFEEVAGMTELNGKSFPVTVVNAFKFEIGDTSKFSPYEFKGSGGYGNQICPPTTVQCNSYAESLASPVIVEFDMVNFGRDQQVFIAFTTMHKLLDKYKMVSEASWDEVRATAEGVLKTTKIAEELDDGVLKAVHRQYGYVISPMACVLGGIVGQEVLKSVSGKFMPIVQFMCLNYLESVPDSVEVALKGDRYDSYRAVFGNAQQEVMQKLKYFMIGAGAIGCEIIKNWAMMGVATAEGSLVTVTDMDRIEKSNLSRQFLFRDSDIGEMKSEIACKAATVMNPTFCTVAHTNKLDESTRTFYNDAFYESLDGVCNALDNIEARRFSDSMCVFYRKPLLESGTLGPKANYQIVVPGMTESYSSTNDAPEVSIPACTLHNFPSVIDHCCTWARDMFNGLFEAAPGLVNNFIDDPAFADKSQDPKFLFDNLQSILKQVTDDKPTSADDCAKWSRAKFEELFNWRIRDLLHAYPVDHITPMGAPFWSGSKRPPQPLVFDPREESHAGFVVAATILQGRIYGIKVGTREQILAAAAATPMKEWEPSKVSIDTGDDEGKHVTSEVSTADITLVLEKVKALKLDRLQPEKFEKDDDKNSHMDFIAAAANLRALNYKIQPESALEIKRIAGKIIPAISTTTAMVCGFVCLEMYKVHCITPKKLEHFRSGFVSLSISMFALSEPIACPRKKLGGTGAEYSPLWDTLDVPGNLTVQAFIDLVKEKWGVNVVTISYSHGSADINVYAAYMSLPRRKERLPLKITNVVETAIKSPLPPSCQFLRLSCLCYGLETKKEVPMPSFDLLFRQ